MGLVYDFSQSFLKVLISDRKVIQRRFFMKRVIAFSVLILSTYIFYDNSQGGVAFYTIPSLSVAAERFDTPPLNRFFFIKSAQSGTQNAGYWDQQGTPVKFRDGENLALNVKDSKPDQQFRFINAGAGFCYIETKIGGLVDVSGNRRDNGTSVQIWKGHGGSNQLFRFKHVGEGRWKIYAGNGTVVSAPQDYSNGSFVHVWEDREGPWMEWYFEDAATGKVYKPQSKNK